MNAPQTPTTPSHEPIAPSTWVALALLAIGWFGLATFVTAFGPVKRIVRFYDLATVLHDPSWLVHGIGSHSLEAFAFGTLSVAMLLAPLAAHCFGTRSSWLLYLLPLVLMVSCGLILYHEATQPYVGALPNAGAVGAFVSRFANEVVGGAADTVARHISLGTGSYVSFAAALYLTHTGVRGYLATSEKRPSGMALPHNQV
jgi:hypothetical protein